MTSQVLSILGLKKGADFFGSSIFMYLGSHLKEASGFTKSCRFYASCYGPTLIPGELEHKHWPYGTCQVLKPVAWHPQKSTHVFCISIEGGSVSN